MSSETERITHAFLDRRDFGKLTRRLGQIFEMGKCREESGNEPYLANHDHNENAESPFQAQFIWRESHDPRTS